MVDALFGVVLGVVGQMGVAGGGEEGLEADVIECLVVEGVDEVSVLYELVHGESRVVGLDDGVGHLGGGHDGEGGDDAVGELLADLGDEQGAEARAGPATERVSELETLKDNLWI